MSVRKIVIYPKSAMKPIVITDTDDTPIHDIEKKILDIFKDNKVAILNTENDCLIIKPSEIQAILVTKKESEISVDKT